MSGPAAGRGNGTGRQHLVCSELGGDWRVSGFGGWELGGRARGEEEWKRDKEIEKSDTICEGSEFRLRIISCLFYSCLLTSFSFSFSIFSFFFLNEGSSLSLFGFPIRFIMKK